MAKHLSIAAATAELSHDTGFDAATVKKILRAQAELAYRHASEGYPVAGIGLLKTTVIPERKMLLRVGPNAGKEVQMRPLTKLKFWVAKVAKEIVVGNAPIPINIEEMQLFPDDDLYGEQAD